MFDAHRRQHRAAKPEIADDAPQFDHCFCGFLAVGSSPIALKRGLLET